MSLPPPSRTSPAPRRRSLLASAAGALAVVGAVGVSGCSGRSSDAGAGSGGGSPAGDRTRARAARDSLALLARYDAVIAAHPQLADRLRPLRAAVARHVTAFGGDTASASPSASASASASAPASASASASASGSASAAGSPGASGAPESAKEALAGLAAAERDLAARRTDALPDVPGELARLLASVAAAGAAHVFLLTEGGR